MATATAMATAMAKARAKAGSWILGPGFWILEHKPEILDAGLWIQVRFRGYTAMATARATARGRGHGHSHGHNQG